MTEDDDHTFIAKFRIPRRMWDAYGRVVGERERGADLLDHVRSTVNQRGTAADIADLNQAEQELAERRARRGGRPRKDDTTAPAEERS